MPDICINQVEYSVASGGQGAIIHIFGRDTTGKAHRLDITGFRPYYYVPHDQFDEKNLPLTVNDVDSSFYCSIRGEAMRRLYTFRPGDVRESRKGYRHHEADIPFTTRFMIDTGMTGGISCPGGGPRDYRFTHPIQIDAPAKFCMVDIECDDSHGFPEPEHEAVLCVACYDSFEDDYITFALKADDVNQQAPIEQITASDGLPNGCFKPGKHAVLWFDTEQEMFKAFSSYIRHRDPDILTGWNFTEFDMPYILTRMETLGMDTEKLARLPGHPDKDSLRGRALFDLLSAYKKMHQVKQPSYRLDAIALEELGEQKVRYAGTLFDLWKKDPVKFIEYNFKDVELCVGINRKNNIVGFYRELARYVGCPLDRTLNSSSVVDVYVLRKAHGKYVLPSKSNEEAKTFEGATVFEPSLGIRENVIVLDLKALYPMSMMTLNASMETKHPDGEIVAPSGIHFYKSPDGITRSLIMDLLKERDEKKRLRGTFPFGSNEYEIYDMQQNVVKVIMNTYYGVSGYNRFRLYDPEIGASVTSVGRAIIEHTRKLVESEGYTVIYGDTDAVFIPIGSDASREETIAIARTLEKKLNASYPIFAKETLNADVSYFSIKFEKIYSRFFQSGKKKRYAGILSWKEGKDVNEVDIVGFEMKRSDTCAVAKKAMSDVMDMILNGKDYEDIRKYLQDVIRKYRRKEYSLDEIGIPGGIGRGLDEYETPGATVRGAVYANTYLGANFTRGSKPKRLYISAVTGKYPKTDVVCFEYADQIPAEFIIDMDLMLEKTLKAPLTRIVESLGWDWESFDPAIKTLSDFGFG